MSLYTGNPPFRRDCAGSGFQEPCDAGPQGWSSRGFRNRTDPSCGGPLRTFSQATGSGYWEPHRTGDQEPRITGYSGPRFVVTGTNSRGFRNRRSENPLCFQSLGGLSTPLNALTSFYNRVSLNAAAAETTGKAPPLGGFAPAGSLRRYAATPRALTRPPTRHPPIGVGLRPTTFSPESRVPTILALEKRRRRRQRREGLSEESLAFSAENPRNRWWAASTPEGRELR